MALPIASPPAFCSRQKYLSSDMLLDGNNLLVFSIALQEGEAGLSSASYSVVCPNVRSVFACPWTSSTKIAGGSRERLHS